jgi:PHP family Zn ribbon phosphoesterase
MLFNTDYHIHTILSGHSAPDLLVPNILRRADEAGLRRILIIEHTPPVNSSESAQIQIGRAHV